MQQVKTDVEAFARIRVIGVGGSGGNAVNHMVSTKVRGVDFVAINTDAQDLHHSLAKKKIHVGKNLTKGLGTGMNPDLGKRAAEETREEIQEALKGSDMIFIACGMGGGTGTGASSVVANIAKEMGALTVAVVTRPFTFEGQQRVRLAEQGLENLRKEVDAMVVIPNDRLLKIVDKETSVKNAFAMCDEVLKQAVEGIADLITMPGIINVDFADIRAVMENAGSALMGIGYATGEKRAEEAARAAINSPLLELSITGAKGVLFSIAGGDDLGMLEIQDAAKIITEQIDSNAKVIFGTAKDEKLKKNEIKVTVIATGFPSQAVIQRNPAIIDAVGKNTDTTEEEQPSRKERGKIYNIVNNTPEEKQETPTKRTITPPPTPPANAPKQPDTKPKEPSEDDDDDWGSIPAFLRRSKLK